MLTLNQITRWLCESDPDCLDQLWQWSDSVRKESVGDQIHLRGLVEISNICARQCVYCGIRADNNAVGRYRMSADEILSCARLAVKYGYGTVVLQAGEDPGLKAEWLAEIITRIKAETQLAITLSLGEKPESDFQQWREAGADRYLIRFETSNPVLYQKLHPDSQGISERLSVLERLHKLGYEVGSGVLIGIPGQSYDDLAADLLCMKDMKLHMIGVGPYILHPDTPLARLGEEMRLSDEMQVPASVEMACKVVALARLLCPGTNIPSTTALATLNPEMGRISGLSRGANIIMPNLTPVQYRSMYEIYPNKSGSSETAEVTNRQLKQQIKLLGREIGSGRGDSCSYLKQKNAS